MKSIVRIVLSGPQLILLLLLPLGSCSSTQKALLYTGDLFGDTVRIYPLPFPVNTAAVEYGPSVDHDWRWMYFGRTTDSQTLLFRTEIDSGYAPVISSGVQRFLQVDVVLSFLLPGRTSGQFICVGCNLKEGQGSCDLYEMILNEDYSIRMFSNLARLNSNRWESYPTVSRSGSTLWYVRDWPMGIARYSNSSYGSVRASQTDIMISRYGSDGWQMPTRAGDSINSTWDETSPAQGFGDSVLLFASDRPGGFGGYDIYVSFRSADGVWGSPMNLGRPINSEWNESGIFVMPNDRHLILTSDREVEGSRGGLDLYVIEIVRDR